MGMHEDVGVVQDLALVVDERDAAVSYLNECLAHRASWCFVVSTISQSVVSCRFHTIRPPAAVPLRR